MYRENENVVTVEHNSKNAQYNICNRKRKNTKVQKHVKK